MRVNKYTQCTPCIGATLAESVSIFNAEMHKLRAFKPTFERCGDSFLIYYTMEERVPETVVDAKELQGLFHRCEHCANCIRDRDRFGGIDKRKKHATCGKDGERVRLDSAVCDDFYLRDYERKEA